MRPGGDQQIPRPPLWRPGGEPPWPHAVDVDAVPLEPVLAAVRARGTGRPPIAEFDGARRSAVLVALYDGERGAEVVLTRRARHLRNHSGEVSFPGGRLDPGETPVQAALREADEEVCLPPSSVELVGELDHLSTIVSRSHIVPVVGRLPARPELRAGTSEVDRILHVPLAELLRRDTFREENRPWSSSAAANPSMRRCSICGCPAWTG